MLGKYWFVIVAVFALGAFGCDKFKGPLYCRTHRSDPDCARPAVTCKTISCEPATPVCDPNTVTCVECLSDADCVTRSKVSCSAQHTCIGCQSHGDCAQSNLCLLDGGTFHGLCAALDDVTYVGGVGASNNQECTKDKPCLNLDQALKPGALRKYVKVTGAIAGPIPSMIENKRAIIYGDLGAQFSRSVPGEVLIIKGMSEITLVDVEIKGNAAGAAMDCVEISDSAVVTMKRVEIDEHGQAGISLSGTAKLSLMDSRVHDNKMEGIKATAGTTLELNRSMVYKNTMMSGVAGVYATGAAMVTIDSSTITLNALGIAGGVSVAGPFSIRNSIITVNGNVAATMMAGGLNLSPPTSAAARFEFNTVSDNRSSSGVGMSCTVQFNATNSIFTDNTVNGCNVTYSLIGRTGTPTGTNKVGDPKFVSNTLLDPKFYRIGSDSAARDSADPQATLGVDIDGQARNDARKDMGADELR